MSADTYDLDGTYLVQRRLDRLAFPFLKRPMSQWDMEYVYHAFFASLGITEGMSENNDWALIQIALHQAHYEWWILNYLIEGGY